MVPRLSRAFAPLMRMLLGIVFCSLILALGADAFQTQIQIESTGPDRKIKTRVSPEYPELALRTKISGTARVELTVTPEGTVRQVKELGGNPVLLGALVRAVKQWKYQPAPRESVMEVKAAFFY